MKASWTAVLTITACIAFGGGVNAATLVITDFTTDDTALDGDLESFDTTGGAYNVSEFASAAPGSESNIVYLEGAAAPANAAGALSDQRVDTGQLSSGQNTYNVVGPLATSDALFVFFNAGAKSPTGTPSSSSFQGPGLVSALDSGGGVLGSVTVNADSAPGDDAGVGVDDAILESDSLLAYSAARVGSSTLAGRLLAGVTIDLADFGVADLSTIAGFTFNGEVGPAFGNVTSFDVNTVGIAQAAIPEPASLALLGLSAVVVAATRRP